MLKNLTIIFTFVVALGSISKAEPISSLKSAIHEINADVVFMRHALAPGFGDPANFELQDCNTQRNLDQNGRAQAELIGEALKRSDIQFSELLSSEWCRCKETASLLKIGEWKTFSGLNSFFQNYADEEKTLENLRRKLSGLEDGVTLMITHQVVIQAVTGSSTRSGELVVFNSATKAFKNVVLN